VVLPKRTLQKGRYSRRGRNARWELKGEDQLANGGGDDKGAGFKLLGDL